MADGYIWDSWENDIEEPLLTLPDVISDLIKTVYNKTLKKQEENDLSDSEAVTQDIGIDDVLYGRALFTGKPSDVGVHNSLDDNNYFYEIPIKLYDDYNFFGDSYFIGAQEHLWTWANNYSLVESAIDNDYFDYYGGITENFISSNNINQYVLKIRTSSGSMYPCMYYFSGTGGVQQYSIQCFTYQYNLSGNRVTKKNAMKDIQINTHKLAVTLDNGIKKVTRITGTGNIPRIDENYFSLRDADDAYFLVATNNTLIKNTYINNVDNSNQYHNTYNYIYNGNDYTITYGDNYVIIPHTGDGLSFDDWRTMLLPVIDDLNVNGGYDGTIVFPTFEEIKYGDQGSFYITPVKQIPALPTAPDVADTFIDVSDYVALLGGSVTKLTSIFGSIGLDMMLVLTFLSCLVIRHLRR